MRLSSVGQFIIEEPGGLPGIRDIEIGRGKVQIEVLEPIEDQDEDRIAAEDGEGVVQRPIEISKGAGRVIEIDPALQKG